MIEITYEKAVCTDDSELKKLWLDCFSELPQAVELFFERNLSFTHIYKAESGGRIVAAVYLVDGRIDGQKAHYLCGAATHRDYRKKGIMSGLIEYALQDAKSRGDVYSTLFPANDGLYQFYARLGYEPKCYARRAVFDRDELENNSIKEINLFGMPNFEEMQNSCLKNNFLLQNNSFVQFAVDYYSLYGVKTVSSQNCMAIFEEDADTANIFYCVYHDIKELHSLILKNTDAQKFVFTGKRGDEMFENSNDEVFGMIRLLDSEKTLPDHTYIGITLN